MIELQDRAAYQLNKVLGNLAEVGYMDTFAVDSYSKSLWYPSPEFPDFTVIQYSGAFIDIWAHNQAFHLDFSIVEEAYPMWSCVRNKAHDEQQRLRSEPLQPVKIDRTNFLGNLVTLFIEYESKVPHFDFPQMPDYLVLPIYRVEQKEIEELVRGYCQRSSSLLVRRHPSYKSLNTAMKNIGIDVEEEMDRLLGYRKAKFERQKVYYLGNKKEDKIKYEEVSGIEDWDGEDDDLETDEEWEGEYITPEIVRSPRLSFRDKLHLGWLNFTKTLGWVKDYIVEGDKVVVDLPDQYENVYEAMLAEKIRNDPEIVRLILWNTLVDSLEEKCFEGVEENAYWDRRVAKRKIKPYLEFVQNKLVNK